MSGVFPVMFVFRVLDVWCTVELWFLPFVFWSVWLVFVVCSVCFSCLSLFSLFLSLSLLFSLSLPCSFRASPRT